MKLESRVADLGSGGGTPALPMAIVTPQTHFHLFEAHRRKALFLREAIHTLELRNAEVHIGRYEVVLPGLGLQFPWITVRGLRVDSALQLSVRPWAASGSALLWITSESKARAQHWIEGWEAEPSESLSEDRVTLAWATRSPKCFT